MAIFDTVTETVKKISYPYYSTPYSRGYDDPYDHDHKLHSMIKIKSNEVLLITMGRVEKFSIFGSESTLVSSFRKDYKREMKIVGEKKTQFDFNKAIRNQDPELAQLDSLEEKVVYRW